MNVHFPIQAVIKLESMEEVRNLLDDLRSAHCLWQDGELRPQYRDSTIGNLYRNLRKIEEMQP